MNEYDENGYDAEGFNAEGFNAEGWDREGFNAEGRDRDGWDRDGYNREGRDQDGYDRDGYDDEGFNRQGRDADGYNRSGYNRWGYARDGYDEDGYDEDGEDRNGRTRCDNGVCDDPDCETCNPDSGDEDGVYEYSADVCEITGWYGYSRNGYPRHTPLISYEFECEPNHGRADAVEALTEPFNRAYSKLVGKSATGKGCLCKRDGSLSDEGVEFVCVPMTLDELRRVLRAAFPDGVFGGGSVRAWSEPDCGMHTHQSAVASTSGTIGKMLAFVNQVYNKEFLIALAGRESLSYAAFNAERGHVTQALPTKLNGWAKYTPLRYKGGGRRDSRTLEFRIFKPSKRIPVLLKNLCLSLAVREFCISRSLRQGGGTKRNPFYADLGWGGFLEWLAVPANRKSYPELHEWLKRDAIGQTPEAMRAEPFRRVYRLLLAGHKPHFPA